MIKIGVVQAAPFLFDVDKTLQTVKKWTQKASREKCRLVLFPEAFIPGYPRGLDFDVIGHYSRGDIFDFNVRDIPDMIEDSIFD